LATYYNRDGNVEHGIKVPILPSEFHDAWGSICDSGKKMSQEIPTSSTLLPVTALQSASLVTVTRLATRLSLNIVAYREPSITAAAQPPPPQTNDRGAATQGARPGRGLCAKYQQERNDSVRTHCSDWLQARELVGG
jgi:hypothetical protein